MGQVIPQAKILRRWIVRPQLLLVDGITTVGGDGVEVELRAALDVWERAVRDCNQAAGIGSGGHVISQCGGKRHVDRCIGRTRRPRRIDIADLGELSAYSNRLLSEANEGFVCGTMERGQRHRFSERRMLDGEGRMRAQALERDEGLRIGGWE